MTVNSYLYLNTDTDFALDYVHILFFFLLKKKAWVWEHKTFRVWTFVFDDDSNIKFILISPESNS